MLRVDGGFKSGVDVMMGAAMGADEYGFGTVAMIATGCIMARICHTNNCPVGVASQVMHRYCCVLLDTLFVKKIRLVLFLFFIVVSVSVVLQRIYHNFVL